uniref:Secretin n=1 Tax=Ornithorhynchus anatinus TaxID=9258 RepID=A0A6I8NQ74_ORNAN
MSALPAPLGPRPAASCLSVLLLLLPLLQACQGASLAGPNRPERHVDGRFSSEFSKVQQRAYLQGIVRNLLSLPPRAQRQADGTGADQFSKLREQAQAQHLNPLTLLMERTRGEEEEEKEKKDGTCTQWLHEELLEEGFSPELALRASRTAAFYLCPALALALALAHGDTDHPGATSTDGGQ